MPDLIAKLRSVRYYGGLPLDARTVTDDIVSQEGNNEHHRHPPPPKKVNRIGLEVLNYKGGKTTLCAGCGHNSISERIVECFYELGVEPWKVAKFSRHRLLVEVARLLPGAVARLQRACTAACRPSPPARCWPTAPDRASGSPATATPPPSASASSCTWCGATCR